MTGVRKSRTGRVCCNLSGSSARPTVSLKYSRPPKALRASNLASALRPPLRRMITAEHVRGDQNRIADQECGNRRAFPRRRGFCGVLPASFGAALRQGPDTDRRCIRPWAILATRSRSLRRLRALKLRVLMARAGGPLTGAMASFFEISPTVLFDSDLQHGMTLVARIIPFTRLMVDFSCAAVFGPVLFRRWKNPATPKPQKAQKLYREMRLWAHAADCPSPPSGVELLKRWRDEGLAAQYP